MEGNIFINYRRRVSSGTAGRIRDRLAQEFGPDNVFMDVESIPAGVDFVDYLIAQVAASDAFLAVIGPNWAEVKDETGLRKIDNPKDYVRVEIEAALARHILVIPVLVEGAQVPKETELPDPLKPLLRRNGIEVRAAQFGRDVEALADIVREALVSRVNASHIATQAVILFHGMYELREMDSLMRFVQAIWQTDAAITRNDLPSPTNLSSERGARVGALELNRISTRQSVSSPEFPNGVRTDFYEMPWTDLANRSTWEQFTGWVGGLLLRPLKRVPPGLRIAWIALWVGLLCTVALALLATIPADVWRKIGAGWLADWHWLLALVAATFATWLHRNATASFGRVIAYTKADPDSIAARRAIRERGLSLLTDLHNGEYDRIVLVGHGIGAVFAYDLITSFWSQRQAARTVREVTPEFDALCALEAAAANVDRNQPDANALATYFRAQRSLRTALAKRPVLHRANEDSRWLISDLVTVGSPLTHAEFLLADGKADLRNRQNARELPVSPPIRDDLDPSVLAKASATRRLPLSSPESESKLIAFPLRGTRSGWQLDRSAPFAAVRWTNIYDSPLIFYGDIVSGPVAPIFGPAIVDVDLKRLRGRQSWSFTHTRYWQVEKDLKHIVALRAAANLIDKPDIMYIVGEAPFTGRH